MLQTSARNEAELFFVMRNTASKTSHRKRGTYDNGIRQRFNSLKTFFNGVADKRTCRFATNLGNNRTKLFTILTSANRIHICTDELGTVFRKNSLIMQFDGGVQSGLSAQCCENCRWFLFGDDHFQNFSCDRFNISCVGKFRIGHDCGWVGIDQYDSDTFSSKYSTCLGAGIIKLAGLANNYWPTSND